MDNRTEKTKLTKTESCKIVSAVEKVSPQPGDVLLFYIKTDNEGIPLIDMQTVQETAKMMGEILPDDIAGLFLFDKICLFSVENAENVIKRLENCISYVQETIEKVRDIENRTSQEKYAIVNMRRED